MLGEISTKIHDTVRMESKNWGVPVLFGTQLGRVVSDMLLGCLLGASLVHDAKMVTTCHHPKLRFTGAWSPIWDD